MRELVNSIYDVFGAFGFPQGQCGQLAEALQKHIGGELVAGYLVSGSMRRSHWWLEVDGEIIDPMADELGKTENIRHEEVHRDVSQKYW